ncbi:MAG: ribosome biogenesis GTPase YlqF [Oscillospiraceae bacterium]|nr:ribosome biogenesis GTPase YlqF [Oscillospiraceae bacterium]
MVIQWYPGHMTKTKRMMQEQIKHVDLLCEIIDARIPVSSRNPDLDDIARGKPRMIVLNRADQADPEWNKKWVSYYKEQGLFALEVSSKSGAGVKAFPNAVRNMMREKIAAYTAKGQVGRTIRAMVVGVPNVGKSTFINQVAGRKSAKAENRPGVTRGRQWVTLGSGLELMDTPGILWPKFEDEQVGLHLAFTGAVRDEVTDVELLAFSLIERLAKDYAAALTARYKITPEPDAPGYVLLEQAARKRGFLISGGEVDLERMANVLLDEFRSGKLGRITLEHPPQKGDNNHEIGTEKRSLEI